MSIGIGIITCGNRPLNKKFLEENPDIIIYEDVNRKGAASARNKIIWELKDRDYIFIFDDDCWPVIPGWKNKITEWMEKNNVGYLAGLDYKGVSVIRGYEDTIISKSPYIGGFAVISKECLEKIGYYNTAYDRYGYEDVGYSRRAKAAGLCGPDKDGYASPLWIDIYIHSADMFCENLPSVLTQNEKNAYINKNYPVYKTEISGIETGKIYYGYK